MSRDISRSFNSQQAFGSSALPSDDCLVCQSSDPGQLQWAVSIDRLSERHLSPSPYVSSSTEVPSFLQRTYQSSMGELLRPVMHLLCLQGVCLHVYLDDWLIRADLLERSAHAQLVIWVLHHLGWMINFQKSELTPTQDFEFIGIHFRTQEFTLAPYQRCRSRFKQ